MTEQTDLRAKQPTPVAFVSGDLKFGAVETLPAGTEPRASHHRSPRGERRRKRKRLTMFLERTRNGHGQTNATLELVAKATLGSLVRDGMKRTFAFPRA